MATRAQKITPCLWFDTQAVEAVTFYVSLFRDSRVVHVSPYTEAAAEAAGMTAGAPMLVIFELAGQPFMALNGGPAFSFSQAISFMANCDTQDEIDYLWDKLSEGGQIQECGWVLDKYGLAWQIVPAELAEMMTNATPEQAERMMAAVLQMVKLDIATIKAAYRGTPAS